MLPSTSSSGNAFFRSTQFNPLLVLAVILMTVGVQSGLRPPTSSAQEQPADPPATEQPADPPATEPTANDQPEETQDPVDSPQEPVAPQVKSDDDPAVEPSAVESSELETPEAPPANETAPTTGATPATNTAPWMRSQSDSPYAPQRVGTPQELLSYYSIDASHLTRFFDGRPLDIDEDEVLFKILFRIPKIQLYKIHLWIDRSPDWDEVMANSDQRRGNFYEMKGRAKSVEAVELSAADAANYEFSTYYKLHFEMDDSPHRGVVCLREIPSHWTPGSPLDEPIQLSGMYLKTGTAAEEGQGTEFNFVANRVNWLPESVNEEWGIREQHLKLAGLGMDYSLFDSVKDRARLRSSESECFFQLLKASSAIQLEQWPAERFKLEEALVSPDDMRGRLFTFSGTVRRINKIEVDDRKANNAARLGFDHYYQVDIFVSLGDREIKLGKDPNAPVIKNRYFVPVCCTTLPPKLEEAYTSLKEDETLDVEVKMTGVYYKLWGYRNELMRSFDDRQLQIAPMLMGVKAEVVEYKFERDPFSGLIIGVAFLAVLGSIWFGLWRYSQVDRAQQEHAKEQMAPKQSLNDLDIEANTEPDFSNLD